LYVQLGVDGTWANTGHPEACPDINPVGCAMRQVPPEWHDVTLYFSELRLRAEIGLTDWLAAEIQWSLRVVVERFVLEDLATRMPIAPPFGADIHHRNETLVGLTDPWIGFHAAKQVGPWAFLFRLGATLPVGATVPNPFLLGAEGLPHEHIQFGTGTVDPYGEVEVRHVAPHATLSASLLGKATLYQAGNGFRAGDFLLGGIHVLSDLFTTRWSFTVGALVYNEQPERWDGVQQTEGNLGRTDLLLDTAIARRLPRDVTLILSARVPVYTIANGEQLATPAILELAVARPFQL
jgi:hypothetical protein